MIKEKAFLLFVVGLSFATAACGKNHKEYTREKIKLGTRIEVEVKNEESTISAEVYEEKRPHVHEYGEWEVVIEESCKREGELRRYCLCGDYETEIIKQKEHNYGDWELYYSPSITSEGKNVRYCTECGNPDYQVIPKTTSYTIAVKFYDGITGERISNSSVSYSVSSDNCDYNGHYAENSKYTARVLGFQDDDYKIPNEQTGIVKSDITLKFTLYPKYSYSQITASVGTVKSGGIYYCLNGKYYMISIETQSITSESPWKQLITYYANETYLGEQIVPWMSYEDTCIISPIYKRTEN